MKQLPMRTRIAVEQSIARGDTASTTMRAAAVTYEQYRDVADHMNAVSDLEIAQNLTGRYVIDGRPVSSYFGAAPSDVVRDLVDIVAPAPRASRQQGAA